jgi:hypothetical protein
MDNVHFNDLLHSSMSDTSSVTMPQSIKNDPKLFKDDVDIRFSRTLNSCKVWQLVYNLSFALRVDKGENISS